MKNSIELNVNQLAKIAKVSVRTLHYYDEIGLLNPKRNKINSYRRYGQKEILKLQQILFFRELKFPLDQINEILNSPKFRSTESLIDHRKILILQKKRLENLINTIDETVNTMKGGGRQVINAKSLYSAFDTSEIEKYQEEARQKWGHTDAYKQSEERASKMTKEDWQKINEESDDIVKKIIQHMGKGPNSPEVQEQINRHYNWLRNFYEPNYEMYKGLGQLYVDDKRFTAVYDKHQKGLSVFIRDAIIYFSESKTKQQT